MQRTCQRPLVLGMNPSIALGVGVGLAGVGFYGLSCFNNTALFIGVLIWSSYLFIYTKMKATS